MAQVCCSIHVKYDQDCGKWLHKRPNFTRLPLLYHRVRDSENSFWASYGLIFCNCEYPKCLRKNQTDISKYLFMGGI